MKKNTTLLLITLLISLTGCGTFLTSPNPNDTLGKRTLGRSIDDKRIETQTSINIKNSLPNFKHSNIRINSYNGIVLLIGQAPDEPFIYMSSQIAKQIQHAHTIENQLTTNEVSTLSDKISNMICQFKAKRSLIESNRINYRRIKIMCEQQSVFLMGIVTRSEASFIVERIRNIDGVKRIIKVFEYLN
jgi:osmotically-inducible protein OsmY